MITIILTIFISLLGTNISDTETVNNYEVPPIIIEDDFGG